MKDLINTLYYIELEENPALALDCSSLERETAKNAYDAFFLTLNKEQKRLYLAYEEKRNEVLSEKERKLYKCAFLSGFSFAKELNT